MAQHHTGNIPTNRFGRLVPLAGAVAIAASVLVYAGCGSGFTGGSLPPSDPDIEGYVLAAAASAAEADLAEPWPPQGTPISDARVYLLSGGYAIDETTTDASGYFRFRNVPPGDYEIAVEPPESAGYQPARVRCRHRAPGPTRLVIRLVRKASANPAATIAAAVRVPARRGSAPPQAVALVHVAHRG